MKRFCLALLLMSASGALFAHTALEATVPDNGTIVAEPPHALSLSFEGEVRLTALSLEDAKGKELMLDSLPTATAEKFVVGIHGMLAPGMYRAVWRAVGADTHIISGEFAFTVSAR